MGNSGSNGGTVTLNLTNQGIEGGLIVDTISSLSIKMIKSSIKGKINYENSSSNVEITLDENSKITLTGDSYISSLTNEDNTGKNIDNGSYSLNINNDTGSSYGNLSGSNTGKPAGSIPGRPSIQFQ